MHAMKCDILSACLISVQPREQVSQVFQNHYYEKKDLEVFKYGGSTDKVLSLLSELQVFQMAK